MDQRLQPRMEVDTPIQVRPVGTDQDAMAGRLSNISSGGFLATLPDPLPIGECVEVDDGADLIVAEVRHCQKKRGSYLVGFQISDWSNKGSLEELLRTFESTLSI